MPEEQQPSPALDFTVDPSVAVFDLIIPDFLQRNPNPHYGIPYHYLCASTYVIDDSNPPRALLVQRASTDSAPNRWEVPGGAAEDHDPSILYCAVRELWEEAGLVAAKIGPAVGGGRVWVTRHRDLVCKFSFLVECHKDENGRMNVRLDPKEHQNFVWATEDEVRASKADDIDLVWTGKSQQLGVLEAFHMKQRFTQPVAEGPVQSTTNVTAQLTA